jgi:hypothetical protein
LSAAVSAADLNVAGLQLGAPIVTTPCQGGRPVLISSVLCVTEVVQLGPDLWVATIVLPFREKPAIMSSERVRAYSKAGLLVGVDLRTHGLRTQSSDMDQLVAKYGTPTRRTIVPMQNRAGGQFDVIAASWALDGLTVGYLGASARLDEGSIAVDLPAAAEVRAADKARIDLLLNPRKL